jgi:glycosyltransferase involved in cell wall biosynthesis
MEEVAGEAAVLADPNDASALAAGLAEAQERRDELVRGGLERAGAFTWKRAADSVEALWRELT